MIEPRVDPTARSMSAVSVVPVGSAEPEVEFAIKLPAAMDASARLEPERTKFES